MLQRDKTPLFTFGGSGENGGNLLSSNYDAQISDSVFLSPSLFIIFYFVLFIKQTYQQTVRQKKGLQSKEHVFQEINSARNWQKRYQESETTKTVDKSEMKNAKRKRNP